VRLRVPLIAERVKIAIEHITVRGTTQRVHDHNVFCSGAAWRNGISPNKEGFEQHVRFHYARNDLPYLLVWLKASLTH
jgi:hypothetical protein